MKYWNKLPREEVDACPEFGWDGVNFYRKPVGLIQTRDIQCHMMSCLAFKWGADQERVISARLKAEHQAVRKLQSVYSFYQCYCYFLLPLLFC